MSQVKQKQQIRFLRYPGGKRKMLDFLAKHVPSAAAIDGTYFEPFAGGGSVFFAIMPQRAVLADLNTELVNLYKALKKSPKNVWKYFVAFPDTKEDYYSIRETEYSSPSARAAKALYLNRTCFKGMWRYNSKGQFNVGYGGQSRRWSISERNLLDVSKALQHANIVRGDFEKTIDQATDGDFIFLDPPYKPGAREMDHAHYQHGCFTYNDQERLSTTLRRATKRGVRWAMTTSSHEDILKLYEDCSIINIPNGTGTRLGVFSAHPQEVLIKNY